MVYQIRAKLEVNYEIEADNELDAINLATGFLLEKIDSKDVAYDDLQGEAVNAQLKSNDFWKDEEQAFI